MPFEGVLPERRHLFKPEPVAAVGVSDAEAWRLNPKHRHVYDKLALARSQGLRAAPCGVDPTAMGLKPRDRVFVKPIVNLAGMSLGAQAANAAEVPHTPGSFWCEFLDGEQTSTDCLVLDGAVRWFAHTRAADERDRSRPVWWEIGVDLPDLEPLIARFVSSRLPGYTGLCNVEMIGAHVIEMHLRGSNAFFDFYGAAFLPAWVALVDGLDVAMPPPIPGGVVWSVFGTGELNVATFVVDDDVQVVPDAHTEDRIAVIRAPRLEIAESVASLVRASVLAGGGGGGPPR
ncbi:MAG: hypothetical protein H6948_01935 [Zoogloeaceae bacterium]|nr:hypothetical protein [Zoogloeaceae bacterium]